MIGRGEIFIQAIFKFVFGTTKLGSFTLLLGPMKSTSTIVAPFAFISSRDLLSISSMVSCFSIMIYRCPVFFTFEARRRQCRGVIRFESSFAFHGFSISGIYLHTTIQARSLHLLPSWPMGPAVSWVAEIGMIPLLPRAPTVGLIPTIPLILDGQAIDPSVCAPDFDGIDWRPLHCLYQSSIRMDYDPIHMHSGLSTHDYSSHCCCRYF